MWWRRLRSEQELAVERGRAAETQAGAVSACDSVGVEHAMALVAPREWRTAATGREGREKGEVGGGYDM